MNDVVNTLIYLKPLLLLVLFLLSLAVFIIALKRCREKCFYSDTHWLLPMGIFVWGDALVLAPFWLVSSVIFYFLPAVWILRYILVFFFARSFFEILYWLNHQAVKSTYEPPLFRKVGWIGAQEAAILYQVGHTCVCVVLLLLLLRTFMP